MIDIAKKVVVFLLPLASLSTLAHGQDTPAVTGPPSYQGFSLPDTGGTLRFGITATGSLRTGYYQNDGNVYSADLSGDAGYLSRSEAHPFSATYSGGYSHNTAGQPGSFFQNLNLSQSLMTRSWSFALSDSVSYLPESPSSGLSGIPGLGDLGAGASPTGGPDPGQDLLSNFGQRISNSTAGSVERKLTGSTSLQGSGSYYFDRFLGGGSSGLDIDQVGVQLTLSHRIDALNNAGGDYTYSRSSYPSQPDFDFVTQGVNVQYSRHWSRQLSMSVSIGPQRSTTAPVSLNGVVMPGSSLISFAADTSLSYANERTSYSLGYFRGTRGGSGVVPGTISDGVTFMAGRKVGRYAHLSAEAAYNRSKTLVILNPNQTSVQAIVGSVQASRVITDTLSAYISYDAQKQTIQGADTTFNGFNGLNQTVAIGITYSPNPLHLGHR